MRGLDLCALLGCVLVSALPTGLRAQEWTWPERAENLTELPPDFPPARLRAVMLGFSSALGVSCSHCHVGEEEAPLSAFDFASDANPNKDRARAMYRMLGDINGHLRGIESSGSPVNMWCHTCHMGRPRPQTLSEAVDERYQAQGAEAAFQHFLELRHEFLGRGAYDFSAGSVDAIVAAYLTRPDTAVAHRLAEHNLAVHMDDAQVLERMGDVWLARDDPAAAEAYYLRSIAVEPDRTTALDKLQELRISQPRLP